MLQLLFVSWTAERSTQMQRLGAIFILMGPLQTALAPWRALPVALQSTWQSRQVSRHQEHVRINTNRLGGHPLRPLHARAPG